MGWGWGWGWGWVGVRQARPRETAALICPCAEWISAAEIARSRRSSAPGHTARAQSAPSQPGSHLVRVGVFGLGIWLGLVLGQP